MYSIRENTPGAKMENQVDEEIKHKRFNRLKALVESQIEENNKKYLETVQKVLIEGKSKNNENTYTGRTDSNKVVILETEENLTGKLINVEIISEHMWYLKGKVKK
jgi:tRNA-2-methylthio-N6-dimethylallyladenosine synthase